MTDATADKAAKTSGPIWLVYVAAVIAGVVLLSDAMGWGPLVKLSARLGVALLFSAVALMIGRSRPAGIIAVAIVWIGTIITFFV